MARAGEIKMHSFQKYNHSISTGGATLLGTGPVHKRRGLTSYLNKLMQPCVCVGRREGLLGSGAAAYQFYTEGHGEYDSLSCVGVKVSVSGSPQGFYLRAASDSSRRRRLSPEHSVHLTMPHFDGR